MKIAVIDQPGLKVFFVGLLLSLFLGYLVKSQISSLVIDEKINSFIVKNNHSLQIDFEKSEFKLTRWGLPLPHLVIYGISISSKKFECQNSQLYFDEIEIPVSINMMQSWYKKDKINLQVLRANKIQLRLNDIEKCLKNESKQSHSNLPVIVNVSKEILKNEINEAEILGSEITEKKSEITSEKIALNASDKNKTHEKNKNFQDSLKRFSFDSFFQEIYIEELKIISNKMAGQPILFKQMKLTLNLDNKMNPMVLIKSRLNAVRDPKTEINFLNTQIEAQVSPMSINGPEFQINLKGRFLDGDLVASLSTVPGQSDSERKIIYQFDAHKISVKAFNPILEVQKDEISSHPSFKSDSNLEVNSDIGLEKWPLSLSFSMLGEAQIEKNANIQIKFNNLEFLGDNTSIKADNLMLEKTDGEFDIKPFEVSIQNLSLNPLRNKLAFKYDFRSVENLGNLTGLLKFQNSHNWLFDGKLAKTEFIFSNRGSREIQVLDQSDVSISQSNENLTVDFSKFKMNDQELVGSLEGEYQKPLKKLQLKLNLEGQILSEKVLEHITQINQKSNIKINWVFSKTNEERHQMKMTLDHLKFPGLEFDNVNVDYLQLKDDQTKSLGISIKSEKSKVTVADILSPLKQDIFSETTGLTEKAYFTFKNQMNFQGIDWKNLNFDLDLLIFPFKEIQNTNDIKTNENSSSTVAENKPIDHLKIKGEWKPQNFLQGQLILQNSIRSLKYLLQKNEKDEVILNTESNAKSN